MRGARRLHLHQRNWPLGNCKISTTSWDLLTTTIPTLQSIALTLQNKNSSWHTTSPPVAMPARFLQTFEESPEKVRSSASFHSPTQQSAMCGSLLHRNSTQPFSSIKDDTHCCSCFNNSQLDAPPPPPPARAIFLCTSGFFAHLTLSA